MTSVAPSDDDHSGAGGKRCQNRIPADTRVFLDHDELFGYGGGLDLSKDESEVFATIDSTFNDTAHPWIKAWAKGLFRYLKGCIVQDLPDQLADSIRQHGFVPTHHYSYYTSPELRHAAGQTAEFDSPAARALQRYLNAICQDINVLYGQSGKPVGKGGINRRGTDHRDFETTQGVRAIAQQNTLMQFVAGPYVLYWRAQGMQVRLIEHSIFSRCVHHASSIGGGVSISLIATCELLS
jgi:hypothetical protein